MLTTIFEKSALLGRLVQAQQVG